MNNGCSQRGTKTANEDKKQGMDHMVCEAAIYAQVEATKTMVATSNA
jgi:hypothetical protein